MSEAGIVRLLLIGAPASEFRLAAAIAREAGAQVATADTPADALAMLRVTPVSLVLIDVEADVGGFMAQLRIERFGVPVLACGINADASRAVAAIRAGARDYVPLPADRALIAAAITSVIASSSERMIGEDPALVRAAAFGVAMAHARVPILIGGGPGSGKEAMARAIHRASGRAGRFLATECAGVSREFVESELFGHEAGAFAGAAALRLGRLEKAHDGTIFLRDIDCLAPAVQAKLNAALAEGASRRIGGSAAVPISARVIVSTSSDLAARVAEGAFRADLLARLTLVRVMVPPLRERTGDIALLAGHFAEQLALANQLPVRAIDPAALALLAGYDWPGNVRELEDVIHRAVLLARGPSIQPADIVLIDGSRLMQAARPAPDGGLEVEELVGHTVDEVERELILRTLARCHGNRTYASSILGISVRTIRNKLKSFVECGFAVAPAL